MTFVPAVAIAGGVRLERLRESAPQAPSNSQTTAGITATPPVGLQGLVHQLLMLHMHLADRHQPLQRQEKAHGSGRWAYSAGITSCPLQDKVSRASTATPATNELPA